MKVEGRENPSLGPFSILQLNSLDTSPLKSPNIGKLTLAWKVFKKCPIAKIESLVQPNAVQLWLKSVFTCKFISLSRLAEDSWNIEEKKNKTNH